MSWLCDKCGTIETEPMKMISYLPADVNVSEIRFNHIDGYCRKLLPEAEFWKELND